VIIYHVCVCVLSGERERSILAGSIQGYYMESAALYPLSRCAGPHLYLAAQPCSCASGLLPHAGTIYSIQVGCEQTQANK